MGSQMSGLVQQAVQQAALPVALQQQQQYGFGVGTGAGQAGGHFMPPPSMVLQPGAAALQVGGEQ